MKRDTQIRDDDVDCWQAYSPLDPRPLGRDSSFRIDGISGNNTGRPVAHNALPGDPMPLQVSLPPTCGPYK
ncbi:hypothetical protein Y032_0397g690 [Ancylostoma ceylanicum]|uniref:Uncharacterized protein n=1 Tax=Ancylostoma ceylanicum TaxID=53326 RepID=A0A016RR54_9BILA|nr:hypothetical protein Y032_0397g690 [Ancylostoma ceylanicum]